MQENPLKYWIPYKIDKPDGHELCYWINTFGEPFSEPFFDDTLRKYRIMNHPHSKTASVSYMDMLIDWAKDLDAIAPAAFIFHISRCGSTLLAQLLAAGGQRIVLSEVPFLDDILRLPFKNTGAEVAETDELLKAAIKFYGQPKNENEQQLFIKTDSWHIAFYKQIRALYPSTPFILMYRTPDEVFRSHGKLKGMHAVPGLIEPEIFGFNAADIQYNDFDGYLARLLENYLTRYIDVAETDKNCLLINYNEGPMPMVKRIAAFIDMPLSENEIKIMDERSRFHSKKPDERFHEEKINSIPGCLTNAMALYAKLEGIRRSL